jgi:chemotaxis protein MotB
MISVSFRKARFVLAGMGLCLAGLLGGCVGQGEYDRLYETNNSLTSRNSELSRQVSELQQQNDLMKRSMGANENAVMALQKRNGELEKLLDGAMKDYKDLGESMAGLNFGPVDPQTDRALASLAGQYSDLIKYDAARGMLRFSSDLTFDSGSAVVKSNATSAIDALSKILNSSAAASYQVVVEGHTDSQKISAGTARMHPTNRHLSAHRAIAVIDELGRMGVPSERMLAAGWGEFKPAVPNVGNGNTPQNRRVEVFLAKVASNSATKTETSASAKPTTKTTKTTRADEIDITK